MKQAVGILSVLLITIFGLVCHMDGSAEEMTAAAEGYLDAVAAESFEQLQNRENLALWYNHGLASGQLLAGVEGGDLVSYDDIIAVISFPESKAQFPVYREGTEGILPGLGHRDGTALPVGGQKTPAVLEVRGQVHPQLPGIGSCFTVQVLGSTLTYRVTGYCRDTEFPEGDVCVILFPGDGGDVAVIGVREHPYVG